MGLGDVSLACATALVDELAEAGLRHACVSPGSRSTPLALALSRDPRLTVHVHLDERSSAFFALGIAKSTGRSVAVACTSGTAAAEFLPAVVEASMSRLPLIVLTADRPPSLRGTGANQTIDQVGLYGGYVRDAVELPVPTKPGHAAWWRQAARDGVLAMAGDPIGPIHINCPFEEPLMPEGESLELEHIERTPWPEPEEPEISDSEIERLAAEVSGKRVAVVVGTWHETPDLEYAELLGWPILAEPTSGARLTGSLREPGALAAGQALIGDATWLAAHRPEVVLQLGATPTTRVTQAFVASAERSIVAARTLPDPDPEHVATWRWQVDPGEVAQAFGARDVDQGGAMAVLRSGEPPTPEEVSRRWDRRLLPAPPDWSAAWAAADEVARTAMDRFMDQVDEPFETRIARDVAAVTPDRGILFVGNSGPIRDLDLAMAPRQGLRVLANRGASGIDGLVSTALGVAASGRGPVVALLGDLALLHDVGALMWAGTRGAELVLVVVNNGGGALFGSLPQRELDEYRDLFFTPHAADLGALCASANVGHERVERAADVIPALERASTGGLRMVEIVVDPERQLARRQELRSVIADAISSI